MEEDTRDDSLWTAAARFDLRSGAITERRRTSSGGVIARANVTRTGVLDYRMGDGSIRREYRPPEEVFAPDSLATLAHATLTDDHPGKVNPDNWPAVTIGHLGHDPRPNGDLVSADLHIEHGDAIAKAESGELVECSCGYDCMLDPTPGVTPKGEPYEAIQRRIRYNHVALGPEGWGRAGPDVRMRLDSASAAVSGESADTARGDAKPVPYVPAMAMTPEEQKVLDDAKKAAQEATDALTKFKTDAKEVASTVAKLKTDNETLAAANAILKEHETKFSADAKRKADEQSTAQEQARLDSLVAEQVTLRADATRLLGTEAKPWKYAGQKPEELRRAIIVKVEGYDEKAAKRIDSLTGPALQAVYEIAVEHADKQGDAWENVREVVSGARADAGSGKGKDADEEDPENMDAESARKCMDKNKRDAVKNRRDRERGAK